MGKRFYLSSLGCAKNQVDSEMMLGVLSGLGYKRCESPEQAEIIIVNTCGFIADAKEESINTILEMASYKEASQELEQGSAQEEEPRAVGNCRLLVVTGCLVEKYRKELMEELPEVDGFLGTAEYHKIGVLLAQLQGIAVESPCEDVASLYAQRQLLTPGYSAYMKIAEGCNNCCSYCLIPQLRGSLHSVPQERLLEEASSLKARGVEEIILIAQDTSNYGRDLCGKEALPELLAAVAELGFPWVRLLYCYPTRISEELLQVIARYPNICHYLDIPIQHINDKILRAMGRKGGKQEILDSFALIRRLVPDMAIRTTLMVGFPGEGEAEFQELLDFVSEAGVAWAGVFAYSQEEDTPAALMAEQVPEKVKDERKDRLMAELAAVSLKHKAQWVGKTMRALVEEEISPGLWQARSQYQAPEVDGVIHVPGVGYVPGQWITVKITESDIYDITGVVLGGD